MARRPPEWDSRPCSRPGGLAVMVLAAASLLWGCSVIHHLGGGGGDDGPRTAPTITLHVENHNYNDATVYAITEAGQQRRIGRVTGLSHDTFTFRWLDNDLRVLIQLLADGSALTQPVMVTPGDSINLVIQPDLHLVIPD